MRFLQYKGDKKSMAAYKRLTTHVVNISKVGKYGLEKKVYHSVKQDPDCQRITNPLNGKHFYRYLPYVFRKRRELAGQ